MSILLNAEEIRQIKETVSAQYRLQKWRGFMPIRRDIDPLAEDYKIVTVEGTAPSPAIISDAGGRPGPNRLPMPSLSRRETIKKFYRFGLRYYYSDQEQQRIQRYNLGLNQANERAKANNQSFEEMLERVAFDGDSDGEAAGLFGDIGLANIATGSADVLGYVGQTATLVTEKPKAAGASNKGWFDLSSGLATATAVEMAIDLAHLCQMVRMGSADRNNATEIIMADELWNIATLTVMGTDDTRNALDIFAKMVPGVNVRPWYKLSAAGVDGAHRIVAFDATDPDGPTMVIPEEMTQGSPYNSDDQLGFYVNQTMTTGGVLVKKPQTVGYLDPVNQA